MPISITPMAQKGADHEGPGLVIRQWAIIPVICAIMIAVHLVDLVLGGSLKNLFDCDSALVA
jgi:hypothetical protein